MKAVRRALALSGCKNDHDKHVSKLCELFKALRVADYPCSGKVTIPCNKPIDTYKFTDGTPNITTAIVRIDGIILADDKTSVVTDTFDAYRLNKTHTGLMAPPRHLCIPTQLRAENRTLYVIGSIRSSAFDMGVYAELETGIFLDDCFQVYKKIERTDIEVVVSLFTSDSIVAKLSTIREFDSIQIHEMDDWYRDVIEMNVEQSACALEKTPQVLGCGLMNACTNTDTIKTIKSIEAVKIDGIQCDYKGIVKE